MRASIQVGAAAERQTNAAAPMMRLKYLYFVVEKRSWRCLTGGRSCIKMYKGLWEWCPRIGSSSLGCPPACTFTAESVRAGGDLESRTKGLSDSRARPYESR